MRKILFFMILVSLAALRPARANDFSEQIQSYKVIRHILPQLIPMSAVCASEAQRLMALEQKYEEIYLPSIINKNNEAPARKIVKEIHKILKQYEVRDEECFRNLSIAYAAIVFQVELSHQTSPLDALWIFFLFKQGKLQPISNADRMRMGDWWTRRDLKSGAYQVYGAYDCESSQIFFDPYKSPSDLRGALEHEMSHLLSDKYVSIAPGVSARDFLLADEVRATLNGAIANAQSAFLYIERFKFGPEIEYNKSEEAFARLKRSDLDFHLFNHAGIIADGAKQYGWMAGDWAWNDGGGIERSSLMGSIIHGGVNVDSSVRLISQGYFAKTMTAEFSRSLVESFTNGDNMNYTDFQRSFAENWGYHTYKPLTRPIDSWRGILDGSLSELQQVNPRFTQSLISIRAQLSKPSASCRILKSAAMRGEIDDYVGLQIPSPGRIHPGNEGVKPGNEGVKPGNEGVKPGNEGVKPGNEGVKPSIGLRPCLSIQTGF